LLALIQRALTQAGGWLPFDRFMALALYAPGLGYYSRSADQIGAFPHTGSDFTTGPELSPLFGQALAAQVAQALQATHTDEIWEFGAGTGALAWQLLTALRELGQPVRRYTIVDLSGSLRARQQRTLALFGDTVRWVDELPDALQGVVLGNEVLDAMPVKLLARLQGTWHERGVAWHEAKLAWADVPTELRPPLQVDGPHDYETEIHPQADAFIAALAQRLLASEKGGAAFFIDYGFPEAEYYHPQRHMGTLICHQAHQAGGDPLAQVGRKDITAHVNFTGLAVAAQEAGLNLLGYTSQARFLMNCGLLSKMELLEQVQRAVGLVLINEHEMGELFKVMGFCTHAPFDALGFSAGDRSHRL
jgi:SAM-dependent MidA family methyltransferase